jgi:hypothetical protein
MGHMATVGTLQQERVDGWVRVRPMSVRVECLLSLFLGIRKALQLQLASLKLTKTPLHQPTHPWRLDTGDGGDRMVVGRRLFPFFFSSTTRALDHERVLPYSAVPTKLPKRCMVTWDSEIVNQCGARSVTVQCMHEHHPFFCLVYQRSTTRAQAGKLPPRSINIVCLPDCLGICQNRIYSTVRICLLGPVLQQWAMSWAGAAFWQTARPKNPTLGFPRKGVAPGPACISHPCLHVLHFFSFQDWYTSSVKNHVLLLTIEFVLVV